MAEATTKLATVTGSGNPATLSFTSISQSYDDLILMGIGADTSTAAAQLYIDIQFANDTGSNYCYGNGSVTTSNTRGITVEGNQAQIRTNQPGNQNSEEAFGFLYMYIPRYTTTSYAKQVWYSTGFVCQQNGTQSTNNYACWGVWDSTTAIDEIDLKCLFGTFKTDSLFTLYGVKNS